MGNLFNALNDLKGNIFGAPSNSGSTTSIARKSAIELFCCKDSLDILLSLTFLLKYFFLLHLVIQL